MKVKNITYVILLFSLMLSSTAFAQLDKLERVQECLKAKDAICAKQSIDSVFLAKDAYTDAQAQYMRAFVYYELAKKDKYNIQSAFRDTSISAAKTSLKLKPDAGIRDGDLSIIKKHSELYYNMCIKYLYDSLNYERTSASYKNYKQLYLMVDSSFNFQAKDVEYYSAVGSHFSDLFNANNTKTEYGENGKIALMKVLELDPKNVSANINLGIIYYNQGVNLINSMDIDTPLDKLEAIQDNSVKLFKQSLPFMTKVYQLDPKNVKALESLRQIYQALNDDAKKEEFNKKLLEARGGSDK